MGSGAGGRVSSGIQWPPGLPASLVERLESAAATLRWLATEAETLTEAERVEAARLPLEIGTAVASRGLARAVRWVMAGEPLGTPSSLWQSAAGGPARPAPSPAAAAEGPASRAAKAPASVQQQQPAAAPPPPPVQRQQQQQQQRAASTAVAAFPTVAGTGSRGGTRMRPLTPGTRAAAQRSAAAGATAITRTAFAGRPLDGPIVRLKGGRRE